MIRYDKEAEAFKNNVSELLNVTIVYATAEIQPFSSQFKPDILILKQVDSNHSSLLIDIYKVAKFRSKEALLSDILERRSFVEEYIERPVDKYLLFVNIEVDEFTVKSLEKQSIYLTTEEPDCMNFHKACERFLPAQG